MRISAPCSLVLLACCLSLLGACAGSGPPQASIDHMAGYDFSDINTFSYLPRKGGPAASSVLSDMEIDRMHQAFASALEAKGMVFVEDRDQADILASWHLVTQEQTDVRSYNSTSYYRCWGCGPSISDVSVRQYTKGTLIFDLVDPELRKSVWRGVMQSRIADKREVLGKQGRFDAIATTMLKSFPPG